LRITMGLWFHGGMKPLTIADSPTIILGLQDEIRRSEESRYDHRLHGVLLVAQGMTCPEVAHFLGDAPRSVEYWVGRFERDGLAGLLEGERPGRPPRLTEKQREAVDRILRYPPREVGLSGNLWDGKTLSTWIEQRYGIPIGVRQCQRMFRQFGFRLRKPRPALAQANVKVGSLRCDVSGGLGMIVTSAKDMQCVYTSSHGFHERYYGTIRKFGLDIGQTNRGVLAWAVFAPTAGARRGAEAGRTC